MKKQLSIDLAGRSFGIEEQAYEILHAYIESFQHRFAKEDSADQHLLLFEEQTADFFSEKQRFGMTTIKESEVHQLIEKFGSADAYELPSEEPEVEEVPFEEASQQESAPFEQSTGEQGSRRRLYRDVNNRMIGGVAAGLSNYLDVDVSIIRIVMLVLCCFTFPVIAAYLIAWLLLKPEPQGQVWKEEPHRFHKKLYRDQRNGMLGGVAAGVSEYFGWKPIWIRLLLLLSAMPWIVLTPFIGWFPFLWFGWTTIPTYIVLWIILPTKPVTNEEKAAPSSTQDSNRMGAEEFAERVNRSNYKGFDQSVSNGFNKGAGCAAKGCGCGCGCLFFMLAVPLLLVLFVVAGINLWGFPISWVHYLRSPEDWFELQPFWIQLILSASCISFVAFSGVGILYAILRVLLNIPPMPTALRLLYWIFWSISLAMLLFCIVVYVMEIVSGTPLWPSSVVL